MEANWSGAQDDGTVVVPHKVEAAPEQDDASYLYQPQTQGLCRFVHTQCEKELFTTEYLRYAMLCVLRLEGICARIMRSLVLFLLLCLRTCLLVCVCAIVCLLHHLRAQKQQGERAQGVYLSCMILRKHCIALLRLSCICFDWSVANHVLFLLYCTTTEPALLPTLLRWAQPEELLRLGARGRVLPAQVPDRARAL